ncbi:MAG TPA: bifunctional protein-serine/threonine kinase/phosphatase [Deltaproteobacteria bacterium]|nr:bifunctional protein-serine/threonine kinase/phosphatase [Deltaproteobacteria bacterium]
MDRSSSSKSRDASIPPGVGSSPVHLEGHLDLTAGQATDRGLRAANEDCMGLRIPEGPTRTLKGVAAVIADGVSSAEAGREAAEVCVQSFLSDYYGTPDSWTVKHSAQVVLTALNRWLYAKSHGTHEAHRGYVSTFSAVVFKSRTAHLFHVGDTRIHRLRGDRIELLTRDHSTRISDRDCYLARAMGMDAHLEVDYQEIEILPGDCFISTTDGIHDWIGTEEIAETVQEGLASGQPFEEICAAVAGRAKRAGSDDNLTCQLVRIDAVEPAETDELVRALTRLPFPPPLTVGDRIDGYRIERELHASPRSQIHLVVDEETAQRFVMKTPSVNFEDDPAYIERFVMESWIGRRIDHPAVVRIVDGPRPPRFLYHLMEEVEGETLGEWRAARETVEIRDVVELVEQIAGGLRAFERMEMVHQDLKPDNVLVDREGRARILDFGSCWVAGIHEIAVSIERDVALGTASYSAPETRWGETAGVRSDLFSLGTLAYELLTGQLPYGEAIESCRAPKDFERLEYVPSHHWNPMIPIWIDGALRKAVSLRAGRRYETFSEFIYDLKNPNPRFLRGENRPWIERNPTRFWRIVAAVLLVLELGTLWLWLG